MVQFQDERSGTGEKQLPFPKPCCLPCTCALFLRPENIFRMPLLELLIEAAYI